MEDLGPGEGGAGCESRRVEVSPGCKFSFETHLLLKEVLGGGGGKAELGGRGGGAGAESPLPGESILFLGGS